MKMTEFLLLKVYPFTIILVQTYPVESTYVLVIEALTMKSTAYVLSIASCLKIKTTKKKKKNV